VAEERERLDEAPAPRHDLGAPTAQEVHRRELLEDADRIVGAEHTHRTGEPDPPRAHRRGGEDDRGRGRHIVYPVVLADPEDIEPDLVGERDLFEEVRQPVLRGDHRPVGEWGRLGEGIDADLHGGICQERRAVRNRSAFVTTLTELRAIAALARLGVSCHPVHGASTPAAIGMPTTL